MPSMELLRNQMATRLIVSLFPGAINTGATRCLEVESCIFKERSFAVAIAGFGLLTFTRRHVTLIYKSR